jgi:hypothetical protein
MRAGRVVAITGAVAGLVGLVAIATAQAQTGGDGQSGSEAGTQPGLRQVPLASAAGGSVASLVFPSVVAVHLDRSTAAIARAEAVFDSAADTVRAGNQTRTAQVQSVRAWQATKYVIRTTPPPPPAGDRAGSSGGAPAGPSFASPPDTSLAVFSLQHDLVTHAAGLLGKDAALNGRLTAVMQKTATRRDAAIAYIHQVAPPAPPVGDRAGASGGAVTAGFDTTMPSVLPLLDDEIQALKGTLVLNPTLPAGVRTALQALVATDTQTKTTINTFWPPIVGDD